MKQISDSFIVMKLYRSFLYYRVIALISANIAPSLDIEGRELAITLYYIAINILSDFR